MLNAQAVLKRQRHGLSRALARFRPMRRRRPRPAERTLSLQSDVLGRINIPVENKAAVAALVRADFKANALGRDPTAATALLRGVMRTDFNQLASGTLSLVGKLLDYQANGLLAHAAVKPALAATALGCHALNLQFLRDKVRRVILHDVAGHTVNSIAPRYSHAPGLFRQCRLLLGAGLRLALGPRHSLQITTKSNT